jgi:N-acetyl sugar amidotransferase
MEDYKDLSVINHKYTHLLHKQPYQVCKRTVMDTSDPLIYFDDSGICNHVSNYENIIRNWNIQNDSQDFVLERLVDTIKKESKGKEFDCIMGLSGGVDSSYMCYFVTQKLGLRALVVHVDTGWNSELAVNNIQNIVQKLNLELHTLVLDWEEIRDLQLSFFRASVANIDIPQDHSFIASLYQEANRFGIKYIMNGSNISTESILPSAWGYDASDASHVVGVHKRFGTIPLKKFPIHTLYDSLFYYPILKQMKVVRPLNFIDYKKDNAKNFLMNEFGWRDYGGKHYESIFTKLFQAHYLPVKFGFDKRKAHLSSLIVTGQLTRDAAILELQKPLYDPIELERDIDYFVKKLGISKEEYISIMEQPPISYKYYQNSEKTREILRKYFSKFNYLRKI